jgi:murein DD-endopeptidase MepM/ murein hydrolase activator NlpD
VGSKRTTGSRQASRIPGTLFALVLLAVAAGTIILFVDSRRYDGPRTAVFPLPERYSNSYSNDWGAARTQGRHEGTDIFAPEGTPIRSITGGTVRLAFGSDESGWNDLGGYTVMVEAAYDIGPIRKGDRLYYAHMRGPTPLETGDVVVPGQKLGEVGDTGHGPPGTRGRFDPHLHLGWYANWLGFGEERATANSGAMNPYPLLRRIERGSLEAE